MRTLLIALVLVAFVGADAQAKRKRRKRKATATYATGQTCVLKRTVKAFTPKKKKVKFKKGTKVTIVKVTKKWVGIESEKGLEGSVKLNKAFKRACKAKNPPPEPEPPPPPEPVEPEEPEELPPMPEADADSGGEMAMPGYSEGPEETRAVGIDMATSSSSEPEKVEPYNALDTLGADGSATFSVERRARRFTTRDWLGYGSLALGAAGIITGGVLYGLASSKAGELETDIQAYNAGALRTTADARDLEDRRSSIAVLDATAITAGAVGLAAVGAGLYLVLFSGDDESVAWVAPSASENAVGLVIGGGF